MATTTTSKITVETFSLGADYSSPTIDVRQARSVYIQVPVTGASGLTGNLSIQASADDLNWLQLGSLTTAVSANGVQAFDISVTGAPYIRVNWARTGGTATGAIICAQKLEL